MLRDERWDLPFPGLMHQSSTFPHFLGNGDGDTQLIHHDCSGHPVLGGATAPLLPSLALSSFTAPSALCICIYLFTRLLPDSLPPTEAKPDLACLQLM